MVKDPPHRMSRITFRVSFLVSVSTLFLPQISCAQPASRSPKVEALLEAFGAATNSSVYEPADQSSDTYRRMLDRLRNPDPETLHLIMEEVTNLGALEKGQIYISAGDLSYRAYRLAKTFEIEGTNAAPLLPELKGEFLSGRSTWGAECGLLFIGQAGWPVFLEGLTNTNQRVQVASMSGVGMSNAPPNIAAIAFPYLCRFATNQSESISFRQFAVRTLHTLAVKPEVKVPVLMGIAETETNLAIKIPAIVFIGYGGLDNEEVRAFLERMSEDKDESVRAFSEKALRDLKST